MLDNKENQRFDFQIIITPKSRGDFGCIRIGGLYRSLEECHREARTMIEEVSRHVDGVDNIDYIISDVYQEYVDISSWKYETQLKGKEWPQQLELFTSIEG